MAKSPKKTPKKVLKKSTTKISTINITTRIVLLVGPSSTGKTTLAKKLIWQASSLNPTLISQDDIINSFPQKLSPDQREQVSKNLLIKKISAALYDQSAKLIVFDTGNISNSSLSNFLKTIHCIAGNDVLVEVTLLKLQIAKQKHIENARHHYPDDPDISSTIKMQRLLYEGPDGSLLIDYKSTGMVSHEFVIDPEVTVFTFDFEKLQDSFDFM